MRLMLVMQSENVQVYCNIILLVTLTDLHDLHQILCTLPFTKRNWISRKACSNLIRPSFFSTLHFQSTVVFSLPSAATRMARTNYQTAIFFLQSIPYFKTLYRLAWTELFLSVLIIIGSVLSKPYRSWYSTLYVTIYGLILNVVFVGV